MCMCVCVCAAHTANILFKASNQRFVDLFYSKLISLMIAVIVLRFRYACGSLSYSHCILFDFLLHSRWLCVDIFFHIITRIYVYLMLRLNNIKLTDQYDWLFFRQFLYAIGHVTTLYTTVMSHQYGNHLLEF